MGTTRAGRTGAYKTVCRWCGPSFSEELTTTKTVPDECIVKNVGSGLLAQAWILHRLGLDRFSPFWFGVWAERYGLLALSLALIGFAAVAHLGVGRAGVQVHC